MNKPPALETFFHTHPHRELLWELRFGIQDGKQREVLGPPGMLYDKVCDAVVLGLTASGQKVVRIKAANCPGLADIWRRCAGTLKLSSRAKKDDHAFMSEASQLKWVLLLEDLDQLCARLYNQSGRIAASANISTWMSQVRDLRVPLLVFGTMRIRSLVVMAAGSTPTPDMIRFVNPERCTSWHEWEKKLTTGWGDRFSDAIKRLKAWSHEHPMAFFKGAEQLREDGKARAVDLNALEQLVKEEHKQTAETIYYNILPEFIRHDFLSAIKGNGANHWQSTLRDAGMDTNPIWATIWKAIS